jgi:hypothetical protein
MPGLLPELQLQLVESAKTEINDQDYFNLTIELRKKFYLSNYLLCGLCCLSSGLCACFGLFEKVK